MLFQKFKINNKKRYNKKNCLLKPENIELLPNSGMMSRAVKDIFDFIQQNQTETNQYVVKISYLQIYTENVSDLLRPERRHLQIRESKDNGVFVENLSEWVVRGLDEIYALLKKGAALRTTAPTKINDVSSRSHAVFIIYLENIVSFQSEGRQVSKVRQAKLNLIGIIFFVILTLFDFFYIIQSFDLSYLEIFLLFLYSQNFFIFLLCI